MPIKRIGRGLLSRHRLPLDVHRGKEGRGTILCIGGSPAMAGAITLTGVAALRAGAGRLQIATAASCAALVALAVPEAFVHALPATAQRFDAAGEETIAALEPDAAVIGPGIADELGSAAFVSSAAGALRCSIVLDAGALAAVAGDHRVLLDRAVPAILTPHCGEMAMLLGVDRDSIERSREQTCRETAARLGAIVVLKDRETLIAAPDGRVYRNARGTAGLATSGSGDVLAGIIGGFLARGAAPLDAALWGVRVHAVAGEGCQRTIGLGFLARELLPEIPASRRALGDAVRG